MQYSEKKSKRSREDVMEFHTVLGLESSKELGVIFRVRARVRVDFSYAICNRACVFNVKI